MRDGHQKSESEDYLRLKYIIDLAAFSGVQTCATSDAPAHVSATLSMNTEDEKNIEKELAPESSNFPFIYRDRDNSAGNSSLTVRVPLKFIGSIPMECKQTSSGSDSLLANINSTIPDLIRPDNVLPENNVIITFGGIEHNKGLLNLLRVMRTRSNATSWKFGLMENSFDQQAARAQASSVEGSLDAVSDKLLLASGQPISVKFLGREIRSRIQSADDLSAKSTSILFSFYCDGSRVISIYGLSALASRLLLEYVIIFIASRIENNAYKANCFDDLIGANEVRYFGTVEATAEGAENKLREKITGPIDPFFFYLNEMRNSKPENNRFGMIKLDFEKYILRQIGAESL